MLIMIRYTATVCSNISVYLLTWAFLGKLTDTESCSKTINVYCYRPGYGYISIREPCRPQQLHLRDGDLRGDRDRHLNAVPPDGEPAARQGGGQRGGGDGRREAGAAGRGRANVTAGLAAGATDVPGKIFSQCMNRFIFNNTFSQVAVVYMTTRLFVNLTQAYVPLYLQVTLGLTSSYVATIPLVMFLVGFVTSTLMKFVNHKIGRKLTFLLGCSLGKIVK